VTRRGTWLNVGDGVAKLPSFEPEWRGSGLSLIDGQKKKKKKKKKKKIFYLFRN